MEMVRDALRQVSGVALQIWTYLRLGNLQVPHLDATGREVGDLELDVDGSLGLAHRASAAHAAAEPTSHTTAVLVVALHGRQTQLRPHEELLATAELLDLPDDGRLLRRVVHSANVGTESGRVRVFGDGNQNLDVVGGTAAFELCFGLFSQYK